MKIFLSYASEDERTAEEIRYALEQEGHEVFLGAASLQPARPYHRPIREAVDQSDLFVFLVSPDSVTEGRYTLTELKFAKEKWPKALGSVLPVMIERTDFALIDAYLTAVTVLEPKGSAPAEVVAEVAKLERGVSAGRERPKDVERVAGVLFDEAHGQGEWRFLPPIQKRGYRRIAERLTERLKLPVAILEKGARIAQERLDDCRALLLPIAPKGHCRLDDDELESVRDFVDGGKGLLLLSTYAGDWHHEANLNELAESYGIRFRTGVVLPEGAEERDAWAHLYEGDPASKYTVAANPLTEATGPDSRTRALLRSVSGIKVLSGCSLEITSKEAAVELLHAERGTVWEPKPAGRGIAISGYRQITRAAVVGAASRVAKVVAVGSWKMFLDGFVDDVESDNGQLFENIIRWLAGGQTVA